MCKRVLKLRLFKKNQYFRYSINDCLETQTEVLEDDVRQLKQELIPIFVVCLQKDRLVI